MGAAYFSKLPGKKAASEVFSELQLDGQGPSRSYSLRGMELLVRADVPGIRRRLLRQGVGQKGAVGTRQHSPVRSRRVRRGDRRTLSGRSPAMPYRNPNP